MKYLTYKTITVLNLGAATENKKMERICAFLVRQTDHVIIDYNTIFLRALERSV